MRILMIFIDGFGLGSNDPKVNPIIAANLPTIQRLLKGEESIVIATDASQGVQGLPQSATGQTALFSGIPASQILGKHESGFPGPTLRNILNEQNILKQMKAQGKKVTFANAYTTRYLNDVYAGKIKGSVTTVCVMAANLPFRLVEHIAEGNAVYQDFTNRSLINYGLEVPLLTPEEAGRNLAKIARDHDFTLYEYFQTDFAGHSMEMDFAISLLEELDRFLEEVLKETDLQETLVVISSDHGNIEDLSVMTHTTNPVPTILVGCGQEKIKNKIRELVDVLPALTFLIDENGRPAGGIN